jgi:glycerol-3-phosphate acyltransferase PlsY
MSGMAVSWSSEQLGARSRLTCALPDIWRVAAWGWARLVGMQAAAILVLSFAVGAIPFSYVAGRRARGIDLRRVGTGTVSGTSLYRVAGFGPLAAAGVLDVAKGAAGPGLAMAAGHPALAAVAGGAAVVGHNWSPFLRGAGGRGISPALGALLVVAWPGTVMLLVGMILGKVFGETAVGALVAEVALTPVLAVTHGAVGALAGISIAIPMLVKRIVGNAPAKRPRGRTYRNRILYDRDDRVAPQTP